MVRIASALRSAALETTMLLQVHDELVFELPPGESGSALALIVREMESAAQLSVPLVVDVGTGANWMATKEH
jgi:DNA polymerase I